MPTPQDVGKALWLHAHTGKPSFEELKTMVQNTKFTWQPYVLEGEDVGDTNSVQFTFDVYGLKPEERAELFLLAKANVGVTAEHETERWQAYAIVDPLDHGAVLEVVRLGGQEAQAYRAGRGWEPTPHLHEALRSVNPPELVPLDDALLRRVLRQVDGESSRWVASKELPEMPTPLDVHCAISSHAHTGTPTFEELWELVGRTKFTWQPEPLMWEDINWVGDSMQAAFSASRLPDGVRDALWRLAMANVTAAFLWDPDSRDYKSEPLEDWGNLHFRGKEAVLDARKAEIQRAVDAVAADMKAIRGTGGARSIRVAHAYFQYASYEADQMAIEVPANQFLPDDQQLDSGSESRLSGLGFDVPGTFGPNWSITREAATDQDLDDAARAVVTAITELYDVPPGILMSAFARARA